VEIGNGRYRLVRRLGEGGTGVVYQAADLVLGRTVAVKALHRSFSVDLLRREGRSLACLNHPNVVALYDVIESEERPYLVMEYVDGCNLEQWLRERGPLPLEQGLEVLRQVAAAIAEAHARGMLHCDLKPANVLISTCGEVKLTDFTLAHRLRNGAFDGPLGASLESAAPEQLSGQDVSPRTDVYALGALLRRMIGRDDVASAEGKQVTEGIERATALEPEERFASVEELLAALPPAGPGLTLLVTRSRLPDLTRVATEAAQPAARARISRWSLGVACAALLIALASLLTHFSVSASPTKVTVPDLVATQSQSAQLVVRSLALRYRTVQRYSSTVPSGTVISQSPGAGSQLAARGTVTLIVSAGPKPVAVPNLSGMSKGAAIATVQRLGLRVSLRTQDDISHDSGTVLDQAPPAGALRVPGKDVVTITVSTKPWWWIF
jgi:serine/threonine-protein kinase